MITIGINSDHDAGVVICEDGRVKAAVSRERVTRIKADLGVPEEAIMEALEVAGLKPVDVDLVCMVGGARLGQLYKCARQYVRPLAMTRFKAMFGLASFYRGKASYHGGLSALAINTALMTGVPKWYLCYRNMEKTARRIFPGTEIRYFGHHEGHSVGAYYSSGFTSCLNVVIEGCDLDNCMVVERYSPTGREFLSASPWPHSPGYFYILVTQLLGYNGYTHGGKITGLAAFGDPEICMPVVSRLMWVEGMSIKLHPNVHAWRARHAAHKNKGRKWLPSELVAFEPRDIAAAFQRRFEDCLVEVVTRGIAQTGEKHLALSGGCVANVRLNQLLSEIPGVEDVFVMPPMGDVGVPVGLAIEGYVQTGGKLTSQRLPDVFWGPSYTENEIETELQGNSLAYQRCENIAEKIATLINAGKVVARFDGRMEFGPRALGNRSILYHCKEPDVNQWLNTRLGRTEFMPFAPAVMADKAEMCFLGMAGREYTSEFMTITCAVTDFMAENCPAAVHVDGTARPQLVTPQSNPSFYQVLQAYFKLTGIPCVINTSFNMHEEPLVMTPVDAIRAFKRGHLDYLAIGDFLIEREGGTDERKG